MTVQIPIPRAQLRRLGDELAGAVRALTQARAASDARDVLAHLTVAVEELSATQHELVNVLLDHGYTWSEVGDALNTSAAAVERRYPRRPQRSAAPAEDPARRPAQGAASTEASA
jgi:DNA-directed RNA polymerase specialized sigma24 family protein